MKISIKKCKYILLAILISMVFISCKKYLDAKTDKQLVVPATLQDAQALLDFYSRMNAFYPNVSGVSDDDYYLTDTYYNGLTTAYQNNYTWAKEAINENEWGYLYTTIMYANLALETTSNIQPVENNLNEWKRVRGSALFYRAYCFYLLAQYYAEPYDKNIATQKPGIPLRLTSDINAKNVRNSMEETYQQIVSDLNASAQLLPVNNLLLSRPSRPAAYAMMARTYLTMEEYALAGLYVDSALSLRNTLLNYNTLDANAVAPFTRFNAEEIFHTITLTASPLSVTNGRIDTFLYQSYAPNDLRKTLFFKTNGTGTSAYYTFKGSYDGTTNGILSNGLAIDEMYLVRAECHARQGNTLAAMNDLNALLIKRWKTGSFVPYTASTSNDALSKILIERRKELVGRTLRWFDLRRLNKDQQYAKMLVRKINAQVYQLPPGDSRYTFLIPNDVIVYSGMQQNNR